MLRSSRMTRPLDGSAINSSAFYQARPAAAMSRALSCVSQVKPSPIECHATRLPKAAKASFSPVCQAPLTNCTMPTRRPWPSMRSASPKAAVDLPLPGPVLTISRPFSIVLPATSASCTALRFAILARWRSASSGLISLISFHLHRYAGNHHDNAVGDGSDPLVQPPRLVAETAGKRVFGHDAHADLVGDHHPAPFRPGQFLLEPT